jgi:WD40 repeat protein
MDALSTPTVRGYELHEQLGVGGYATVHRATQPLIGRDVAIKIIHRHYANHPEFIRRFEAEAQLVARLEHLHIVPLYDYWREPDGAYLVMRWFRGGSLHDQLTGTPWSIEAVMPILDQIGAALTVAHRRNVIHRDLKPANILLDEDGNAYLADFGIAKDLGSAYQTDHSGVIGSPAYISPEQIHGEPVTPQTDIYSLAIMLYEILTGALPFEGPTPMVVLFKHVHETMPPLHARRPDLPAALSNVIHKATAKQPTDRYADVLSMIKDFRRAVGIEASLQQRGVGVPWPAVVEQRGDGQRTPDARSKSIYETAVIEQAALLDAVVPMVENPYKGLRAFQIADATDFFGREALIQLLLARMQEAMPAARFLAVVGPSGSGKSSVVHAGLLPELRKGALPGSQHWFLAEMNPGTNPLQELETALLRVAVKRPAHLLDQLRQDQHGLLHAIQGLLPGGAETELVLVIDQFEELFTFIEDEATRVHVLNSLHAAVTDPQSRLRLIVTLRADFYDRPLLYSGFGNLMRQRTEALVPLAPEELQHAIVGPARRVGLMLEPDLIAAMLHDVSEQPGALPLLQYALTELFERRQGRKLTLEAYRASGGLLGALVQRAEEIYGGLNDVEQEAARQLFLRLVALGEGAEDTRRRVQRAELMSVADDGHALDRVIDTYCQYRLLTLDHDPITRGPTVEVAHEALIRTWDRLRNWLDVSREDLRLQRRLARWAMEWDIAGRDPNFLVTGARLDRFAAWATETHVALNVEERAYLEASIAQRENLRAQELAREAHEAALEQRSRRFLRALVVVLLVAALGAFGLAGLAISQRQEAQRAQDQALIEATNAKNNEATAIAAQAQVQIEAHKAEQQANRAERTAAEAQKVALSAGSQAALFREGNTDQALALALTANRIDQPVQQAELALAEAAYAPGTRQIFTGHTKQINAVAFSPDGKTALSGSVDTTLILWDVATGKEIRPLKGHTQEVRAVVFSPDGKTALSGSVDKTLILWDVATGKEILPPFVGHDGAVNAVAFSPDGKTALSGSADKTLILWDVATGKEIRPLKGHTQEVRAVVFSPDGTRALSGSNDTTMILWDVATGKPIHSFKGHKREVRSVAFSPDGTTALSGSADTNVILWDAATGKEMRRFPHPQEVFTVVISRDSNIFVSGSQDGRLRVWNVATGELIQSLVGHSAGIRAVAFSPDGKTTLSGSADRTLRLWDLGNGAEVQRITGHTDEVWSAVFSPDGKTALSGSVDTTLILWDVATGREIHRFAGHAGTVTAVAFSPDGKTALSGSVDTTLILWDVATGEVKHVFHGHTDEVHAVAFSPDGKTALSGSLDKTLILWDVATGEVKHVFHGHTDEVHAVAFSPDGKTALSGSLDKTLILWDVATGKEIRRFKGHTDVVRAVAFSPDGTKALSGSTDTNVILWDVATGKEIHRFDKEHTAVVRTVAFSPDGTKAFSGAGGDPNLILWDVGTGKKIRQFAGHAGTVNAVVFSPDGNTAFSGSADTNVIMWDVATAEVRRRFRGHSAAVTAVAFSPDGRIILSASRDKTVRLWRLDSKADLITWAQANRYVPDLTCDQRKLYRLELCSESSNSSTP